MGQVLVRGLDDAVIERLRQRADSHHRSLEATWKYLLICSVGIALAFLGTVLVYLAALHAGGHSARALDWTWLMAHARHLDPSVMRLAFALIILGYGTKVGLAPMHSWLPDAHSQAPAPISALMSGVLLTVAFYAILRFKSICDLAVGPGFARTLLVIVALLSLAVAASLLLTQRDYKRMLAYHSVEHMGLIALGAAAGSPLAIAAPSANGSATPPTSRVLNRPTGYYSIWGCKQGEVAP